MRNTPFEFDEYKNHDFEQIEGTLCFNGVPVSGPMKVWVVKPKIKIPPAENSDAALRARARDN